MTQMSINKGIHKQIEVYPYKGILLSNKNYDELYDTCNSLDRVHMHFAK